MFITGSLSRFQTPDPSLKLMNFLYQRIRHFPFGCGRSDQCIALLAKLDEFLLGERTRSKMFLDIWSNLSVQVFYPSHLIAMLHHAPQRFLPSRAMRLRSSSRRLSTAS